MEEGSGEASEIREERMEQEIKVRQVTDYQATWTELERGAPGAFTFQLILDHGAEEYVIRPDGADAEVLTELFACSDNVYFDLDRKVLMFGNRPVAG